MAPGLARDPEWLAGMVSLPDGHLAYHRTGSHGPPIVLVHGLTDTGLCWRRTARALADGHDVVMLDARGHGDSTRLPPGAAHDPADDIAQAIDALGLHAPVVIGHSVGARAAASFAAAYPDRASKLVLEDPPLVPPMTGEEAFARRLAFRARVAEIQLLTTADIAALGRADHPDWHDDDFPDWIVAKQQVDPNAIPSMGDDWQSALSQIAVPTLLIHGESARGSMVSAAAAGEAIALNPRIRAVRIAGAGHNVRREQFDGFIAAVRGFLCEDPERRFSQSSLAA